VRPAHRLRQAALAILVPVLLSACAAGPQLSDYHISGPAVELNVPFQPQEGYQGGPAALAMMLAASGAQVAPADLVPQVYNAERHDTSLVLLPAAVARYGRVAYVLHSKQLDLDVARLVQKGHPVMVLLHSGLSGRWQFAVVTGVDPGESRFTLSTGTEQRRSLSYGDLVAEWKDGEYWAMLVQRPGDIPDNVSAASWVAAAAPLEQAGKTEAALDAYAAVTQRWPQEVLGWEGLGNAYYALHNYTGATTAFQNALKLAPRDAGAHNNLAQVLLERQCADQAEDEVKLALRLEPDPARRAIYQRTLYQVQQHSGPSVVCPLED
jgi:tetratricopeptide (TPR) repeat protein